MAVKCILTGQEKVNLSGDTMTGDLKVGSSSIGTNGYIEGTWLKTTKTTESAGDFATISGDGWIYKRKPANVLGDIGAQSKITANGILKGDGTGNITAASSADFPKEVFWATYGTTTSAEIRTALNNNQTVKINYNGVILNLTFQLQNSDFFVFVGFTNSNNLGIVSVAVTESNDWNEVPPGKSFLVDKRQSVSLPAASWTGSDPYSQTINTSHMIVGNYTKVDIQPSEEVYDQLLTDNVSYLAIKNVNGTLTAVAKGGKPSVDLTVQVTYNSVY